MPKTTTLRAKNNTASTITTGKVVYATGYDEDARNTLIALADYTDASKLPAIGVVCEDATAGQVDVIIRTSGACAGFDTVGIAINTEVYVGENGDILFSEPTSGFVQQIGTVLTQAEYPYGQIQVLPHDIQETRTHARLTDVTANQHHPEDHAYRHRKGGSDPLTTFIEGIGTEGRLPVWTSSGDIGDTALTWDGTNIGIGTATPGNKLDVVTGATTDSAVHIGEAIDEGVYITNIAEDDMYLSLGAEYVSGVWKARATTSSSYSLYQGGHYFQCDTSLTDGDTFTPTTKMVLGSNGRLGLGANVDTTPDAGIHLKAAGWPNTFIYLDTAATSQDCGFRLYENGVVKWHIFNDSPNNDLRIYNSAGTKQILFADQATGNVNIGQASDGGETLYVNGTFGLTGDITASAMQQYASVTYTVANTAQTGLYTIGNTTSFGGTVVTNTSSGITFSATTGEFTIANAGTYKIDAVAYLEQSATAIVKTYRLFKNNATVVWHANATIGIHSLVDPAPIPVSVILDLAASDVIELQVDSDGANTIRTHVGSTINIMRIA